MRIDNMDCVTIADGKPIVGAHDVGLFHRKGSDTITTMIGDGGEYIQRFENDRVDVERMNVALKIGTGSADDVEAIAKILAAASGEPRWVSITDQPLGGIKYRTGREYWQTLARAALGLSTAKDD